MKPDYKCEKSICVVSYKDSIDFQFCQQYELIDKEFLKEADHFILDLKEVSFIDSAGIGSLIGIFRQLDARGKSLCLINLTSNIKKVLKIAEIEHIFPIFNNLSDAEFHYKNLKEL
jgi:anti-anti-sigma factor